MGGSAKALISDGRLHFIFFEEAACTFRARIWRIAWEVVVELADDDRVPMAGTNK